MFIRLRHQAPPCPLPPWRGGTSRFTACVCTHGTGTCNDARVGSRWLWGAGCPSFGGTCCGSPCSQDERQLRTRQTAIQDRRQQSYSQETPCPIEFCDASPQRFRLSCRPDPCGVGGPFNSSAWCTQLNVGIFVSHHVTDLVALCLCPPRGRRPWRHDRVTCCSRMTKPPTAQCRRSGAS